MGDADLLRLVRYRAGLDKTISGAYLRAADIDRNGKNSEDVDLLKMARILIGADSL